MDATADECKAGRARILMKGGPVGDLVRSVEETYRASRRSQACGA